MSDALENALATWFARALTGESLDAEQFAAEHGIPVEQLRASLEFAPRLVDRHRQARAQLEPAAPPHDPGSRLGDHEIVAEIGRGAMGVVYRAVQHPLGRVVALKVLASQLANDRAWRERFLREAQAVAALDHPHIVRVLAAGEQDGVAFLAMEWIDGRTLADLLQGSPARRLRPREAALSCEKLARALHHAHERGILHRDVKPANVLIDAGGEPHLADFGLAKRLADVTATARGDWLGSPAYASPEQVSGDTMLGPQSDVWSLGVTLYECLSGQRPFAGATVESVVRSILEHDPVPVRRRTGVRGGHDDVDRSLEAVCMKALAKPCAERYASAAAFADDLAAYLRGEPVSARGAAPVARLVRTLRRHPWRVCAASAALLLLLGGGSAMVAGGAVRARELLALRGRVERAQLAGDAPDYARALDAACAAFPDDPQLRIASAACAIAAGDLDTGRSHLLAAAPRVTDAARAREVLALAAELSLAGQRVRGVELAPSDAERLAALGKAACLDPAVAIARGHLLMQLGRWNEAVDSLSAGRFAEVRYTALVAKPLAEALCRCGRAREAYDLLVQWTSAQSHPLLHWLTVNAASLARDPARTRDAYARMQRLHPDSAYTAAAELALHRPDKLGPVLPETPDVAFVEAVLGRARRAADWPSAEVLVQRVAANLLCRAKRHEEAAAIFERLSASSNAQLGDLLGLACSLLFSGDEQRGLTALRAVAERAESRPMLTDFYRGVYLLQAHEPEQALPCLVRAAELVPTDVDRWRALAWTRMKLTETASTLEERQEHARAAATGWERASGLEPTTRLYWESEGIMVVEVAAIAGALGAKEDQQAHRARAEQSIRLHAAEIADPEREIAGMRRYLEERVLVLRRKYRSKPTATSTATSASASSRATSAGAR